VSPQTLQTALVYCFWSNSAAEKSIY
jgi:hypothetical protein